MVKMIARRQLTYAGKRILPGSEFGVSLNRDVKILSVMGYASIIEKENIHLQPDEEKTPGPGPEPQRDPDPDLNPEPEEEPELISPEPPKRTRRRYRRRDMKAEDA